MKIQKPYLWGLLGVTVLGLGLAIWALMGQSQVSRGKTPVVKMENGVTSEEAFHKEFGAGWKIIRGARGNITRITGGRIPLQDVSAQGVRALLHRLLPLYGVEPEALGRVEHVGSAGRMQNFFFPQEKEGYRVMNAGVTVYFNLQEEVVNIEGDLIPLRGRLRDGQLSRDKALAQAKEELKVAKLSPTAKKALVYPRSNGTPELVWIGESGTQKDSVRVVVSAHTGRILETGPIQR